MPNPFPVLDDLYSFLAQRQFVTAAQQRVCAIYEKVPCPGEVEALRLSKGRYKKLQDEVRPALIYAACQLPHEAEIRFNLSDRGRDATAWADPRALPILIEATVALGKVRRHQMEALNRDGLGHGFTDATDEDSDEYIKARYEDHRGYGADEVIANVTAGIKRCVRRKAHLDCTLVIAAPLEVLPAGHWERIHAGDCPRATSVEQRVSC